MKKAKIFPGKKISDYTIPKLDASATNMGRNTHTHTHTHTHMYDCRLNHHVRYLVVLLELLLISWAWLLHHHSKVNVGLENVYHLATAQK